MESLLAQVAYKERGRLRVVAVDVGHSRKLARALSVDHVPTLLLIRDGCVRERLEGRASRAQVEAMIERHAGVEPRSKAA
jgi:thioredoxin-like negative regulator of GroEL